MGTIFQNGIEYSGGGATVYSDMTGATASTSGTHGLVPAPASGDNAKFLRGDGTWQTVSGGSSSHTYSTTEHKVGTWIDGSAIYEKTYSIGSDLRIDENGVDITSYIDNYSSMTSIIHGHAMYISTTSAESNIYVALYSASPYVKARCAEGGVFNYITLQYTKTSNRSLNASLTRSTAQISEETNEVEEIPTEGETAENEANNEIVEEQTEEEPKEEMR